MTIGAKIRISALLMVVCLFYPFSTSSAQDLSFTDPEGAPVPLSSFRGKVAVLLFGGIQDPQCREEFRALNLLAEKYRGKNVVVCWISINPQSAVPNDRLKPPCGPTGLVVVLRDGSQTAFKRFTRNAAQLPTLVIIDRQGQMHGPPQGGFNPAPEFVNSYYSVIDALL